MLDDRLWRHHVNPNIEYTNSLLMISVPQTKHLNFNNVARSSVEQSRRCDVRRQLINTIYYRTQLVVSVKMADVLYEIGTIRFGILSPREILEQSTVEITNGKTSIDNPNETVYDPRMGPIKGTCVQCGLDASQCNGHTGYIDLRRPLINPMFLSHVVLLLKFVCCNCHRLVIDKDHMLLRGIYHLAGKRRFLELCELVKRLVLCAHCQEVQPDYKIIVTDTIPCIFSLKDGKKELVSPTECLTRFENLHDDEVRLMGFDPSLVHPKNYVMTRFPIIPTCCRPYVINEGQFNDDDLTYQLVEIVKNNLQITADAKDIKYYNNLWFRVSTYFNNTGKKAKHATTGRPIKGIRERIGGKEGYIRNNLLGKRVNQSARTVIGPDPAIDMETLVVPRIMAEILTVPEIVSPYNRSVVDNWIRLGLINYIVKPDGRRINMTRVSKYIVAHGDTLLLPNGLQHVVMNTRMDIPDGTRKLVLGKIEHLEESITPNVEVGDVVHRQLMDGDFVMLNRQPTLHKASMMALRCKIMNVKTLKINLAISRPFNCDFDGDEMNIHVPQSLESRVELEQLSVPSQCIISTQAGKPNICIVQDTLSASYLITKHADRHLPRDRFFQIVMSAGDTLKRYARHYRFIDIINHVLPASLNYSTNDLVIKQGHLVSGELTKKYLGSSHLSLIKYIYHSLGTEQCLRFVNKLQFVCNQWLLYYGFTVHAEDCLRTGGKIDGTIDQYLMEAELARLTYHHPIVRENKIIDALSKAKDTGMKIAKENLHPKNNFLTTVESGSKGDYFNISQITGLLGQQITHKGRIHGHGHRRTLPHFSSRATLTVRDEYKSKGFIANSFESGLDPLEFFFHSISGRKGVSDTALSTATSGYNMRRIVKLTEDITIKYDGTVRDVNKRLYQMCYNTVGYDPTKITGDTFF